MVSLGKTSTPEFGSPCYTEPDGAPPAVTPWDRDPDGRRLLAAAPRPRSPPGWCRSRRAPTAAARSGSRPRCCGLVGLKPTRGRISGHPMYGDPVGLATAGSLARTVRDAAAMLDVLAGPARGRPVLGAAARRVVPRRLRPRARPAAGRAVRRAGDRRRRRATRSASRPGRTRRGCWSRSATRSWTSTVPLPPEAVPTFETCWAVLTALSVVPPGAASTCCGR